MTEVEPTPPLTVLIADDEPLATERLEVLLSRLAGVDVIGTASDGEAAVAEVARLSPDVVLLDTFAPVGLRRNQRRATRRQSCS